MHTTLAKGRRLAVGRGHVRDKEGETTQAGTGEGHRCVGIESLGPHDLDPLAAGPSDPPHRVTDPDRDLGTNSIPRQAVAQGLTTRLTSQTPHTIDSQTKGSARNAMNARRT